MRRFFAILCIFLMLISCKKTTTKEKPAAITADIKTSNKPNILIIYTDDLGYGDVGAYVTGKSLTPNIDRLATEGIRFTNGYASSATCSPSRYALLTGQYPWRNKNAKILPGTAPLLIDTTQVTLPKLLNKEGYQTAVIGKWHLGLGTGKVNWNQKVSPGPNEVGFDYSYIMAATQDRVPTVYLENGLVQGLEADDPIFIDYEKNFEGQPTGKDNPELLTMKWHHGHNSSIINGIPRIGYMKGGKKALWNDVDMADNFLNRSKKYIKENKNKPFFLYYAMQQPHVPRTPHPRFVGKSGLGPRGDVIVEADWAVGEIVKTLEEEGILENTLIFFSSDNGPVLNDGYYDDAVEKLGDHKPMGPLRGGKYSLFEAGTRVPFIIYWKNKIQPKVSNAIVSQLDILSSFSNLIGSNVFAEDSKNLVETFKGTSDIGREVLILEATSRTALRKGNWLMIPPYKGPAVEEQVDIELGNSADFQLYNLKDDIEQQHNLAATMPEKLEEMIKTFIQIRGEDYNKTEQLILK
ncbi:sulfatase family protein [Aquimarina aggregata]|uniref:sulfatase family protein n=1 Tax=Aquimarina aggregata TaxID=1642818 RepID=UPI002492AE82|nr:arylsulfatase [Aquimarina aggregata]